MSTIQQEFDAQMWYAGLHSDMEGMSNHNKDKHFRKAGIFGLPEFSTVTTLFNQSPSSLKDSKPTYAQNQRTPGGLTSWNQRRADSKLKYTSENAFPCQRGGVFPDPSAEEKRLKTFLHHRLSETMKTTPKSDHDQENDEE